ncbi:hypothetical protein ACVW19_005105 [Streptomyces sp. TE5632]
MAERIARRRGYREGLAGEMIAEFLGTFVLILLGTGSVAVAVVGLPGSGRETVAFGPANWLIISWGWGLAVVFGVYVAGGISGAHINPAVTLSFAVRRDFPWRKVLPYWLAQFVGAFVGAALVYASYRWAIDMADAKAGNPAGRIAGDIFDLRNIPRRILRRFLVGPPARPNHRHRNSAAADLRAHRHPKSGSRVQSRPFPHRPDRRRDRFHIRHQRRICDQSRPGLRPQAVHLFRRLGLHRPTRNFRMVQRVLVDPHCRPPHRRSHRDPRVRPAHQPGTQGPAQCGRGRPGHRGALLGSCHGRTRPHPFPPAPLPARPRGEWPRCPNSSARWTRAPPVPAS